MNHEQFRDVFDDVIDRLNNILIIKGKEYARSYDRLRNFKDAAEFQDIEPEQALFGFVSKHMIALKDFISTIGDIETTAEEWDEKIFDIIAYMILLKALLVERDNESLRN